MCVCMLHVCRDSYRILGLGWETQHLGGSGGMFPQESFFLTNALRLILGHFLVHIYAYPCQHTSFIQEVMHSCITEGKVVVM